MSKTPEQIHYNMSQVKNKGTKIETILSDELTRRGLIINGNTALESFIADDSIFRVGSKKRKVDSEKGTIQYNEAIVISNIPEEAFGYVVNGRSALAWIAEMYHVTTDKDTGIVNDPNEYAGGRYIFDLIGSIVTVSVETVRIQDSLPKLNFDEQD